MFILAFLPLVCIIKYAHIRRIRYRFAARSKKQPPELDLIMEAIFFPFSINFEFFDLRHIESKEIRYYARKCNFAQRLFIAYILVCIIGLFGWGLLSAGVK